MALALAGSILADRGIPVDWVDSAGTLGIEGQPAASFAIEAVRELGLDLSRHLSKGISEGLVDAADYILAMAPDHVREIRRRHPRAAEKTVPLWEFTTREGRLARIADPIGRPLETYLLCREDLVECLGNWADSLPASTRTGGSASSTNP